MMNSPYANPEQLGVRPSVQLSTAFLSQAFAWMFIALLVTTGVGTLLWTLPEESLMTLSGVWIFILIGQFALAFTLSLAIKRLSATVALLLFFVYAASMGVTLGLILWTYELGSVLTAGVSAASIFAGAAIYGAVTKRNLASMGGYLFMALIGLLVAMVVNLFVGWETLNFIISVVGVLIFTGLTAYDVQRIQRGQIAAFTESMEKGAVMGAFVLYLDFVNLFLMLLRLFGNQR
jgi:FtsH-binding integral membrane protein